MRWYRTKFVVVLLILIVLDEVTPFVPLLELAVVVGCFAPMIFLTASRWLLRFYDAKYGTTLASRIPSHAVALRRSAAAEAPATAER